MSAAAIPIAHNGGSQQLRQFRRAIRDGQTLEQACAATGGVIGEAEGRIYLAADAKAPPPPEAFELIAPPQRKDPTMGRPKKQDDDFDPPSGGDVTGEYSRPDAAKAFEIYDEFIAPKKAAISTLTGDCSQPWQDIKKHAHFPRSVMNFLLALEGIDDDAKRDHHLLALSAGLAHRGLFLPRDLVTIANGEDGDDVVPTGERKRPHLTAIDGGGEPDDDFEMSDDELALQRDRRENVEAQVAAEEAAETEKVGKPSTKKAGALAPNAS